MYPEPAKMYPKPPQIYPEALTPAGKEEEGEQADSNAQGDSEFVSDSLPSSSRQDVEEVRKGVSSLTKPSGRLVKGQKGQDRSGKGMICSVVGKFGLNMFLWVFVD
ncbi:hypothetical protein E2C01_101890 [Portunus trituberculatus]|uniref:Uncharacterized protein n=1 Tax=Portunus trituberculatus TaxID=210409 RepID=A0A5B7KBS6_PORTR|nr:hypothetical protein [Portunus trituberculatus]